MVSNNILWLEVAVSVTWIMCVAFLLHMSIGRVKRRTRELKAAARSLSDHYDALDKLIEDPATPTSALEFLALFSEVVTDRDACRSLTDSILSTPFDPTGSKEPEWARDMRKLSNTREDLAENFQKALHSGIFALYLRWPGNSWKLYATLQEMNKNRKTEAIIVDRMTRLGKKDGNGNGSNGPFMPGGLQPV